MTNKKKPRRRGLEQQGFAFPEVPVNMSSFDEKTLRDAYSGDVITEGRVRKPLRAGGREFTVTGFGPGYADAVELIPREKFPDRVTTYEKKLKVKEGDAARNDPKGFYYGMAVRSGGREYVLGRRLERRTRKEVGNGKRKAPAH